MRPARTRAETITATAGHPFWVADQQQWREAKDLKPGYTFETADHRPAAVAATHHRTQPEVVHNLTVDTLHTYYVLAGKEPVLVHNNNGCDLADIAATHRVNANNGLGVKGGTNIAVRRSMIDGQSPATGIATSGRHVNPGEVGMPTSRQFTPPNPSRAYDPEVILLEDLAQGLDFKSTGAVHIYSERTVCPSRGDVIDQFQAKFPGVKVHVQTGED
ncbi:polymorphic toxin-type HINT domain-containing protein [Micromonospora sp. WMMD735]|uniref:polymorphic toxin-type HINT domain-containing protein n=1 Tax=Micromonospora sp. WMMD735 TaxID=3404130 RepID=UPI003B948156